VSAERLSRFSVWFVQFAVPGNRTRKAISAVSEGPGGKIKCAAPGYHPAARRRCDSRGQASPGLSPTRSPEFDRALHFKLSTDQRRNRKTWRPGPPRLLKGGRAPAPADTTTEPHCDCAFKFDRAAAEPQPALLYPLTRIRCFFQWPRRRLRWLRLPHC
jgi:hypothetical protein